MNNAILSESAIHYVAGLLDHYAEKNPSRKHQDVLNEFRNLSNYLLETLEEPTRLSIYRHKLNK